MSMGDRIRSLNFDPSLLERIESRQKAIKENPIMAVIIKKSSLPVLGRGKTGAPTVTVAGKGQISFSPVTSKAFEGRTLALVGWDDKTRTIEVLAFSKPPKGYTEADMFTLGYQKKSKSAYFSASSLLQDKDTNIGYDYKSSGNQTFSCEVDAEKHVVRFKVPAGKLTAKPVTPRKKKETPANTAPTPETAKTATAGAGGLAVLVED